MRAVRMLLVGCLFSAALPISPVRAETVRVGPVLAGGPAPTESCGEQTCSAAQLAGTPGAVVPASGTISRFRLRHGPVPGGLVTTEVHLQVYSRSDNALTLLRESPAVTVPATTSADTTNVFVVSVPVAAGNLLGVRVVSPFRGNDGELKVIGVGGSADTVGRYAGNHPSGTASYGEAPERVLLMNADLDTSGGGGGDSGGGDSGGGGGGSGDGDSGGGDTGESCPTRIGPVQAATIKKRATPDARGGMTLRRGAGGWRGGVVHRGDNFNDIGIDFDRKGRTHVAGRGVFYRGVFYAGPTGKRTIASTASDGGGASMAFNAKGKPVVGFGDSSPHSAGGLIVYCPRLRVAVGKAQPTNVRVLPETTTGFFYTVMASPPGGGRVHIAYEVGERLHYQYVGGKPTKLPFSRARTIRIAAGGRGVAVGALTGGGVLTVFSRKGTTGAFTQQRISGNVDAFDLAVGPDGVARVAFARNGSLWVFNGRTILGGDVPARSVGVAVDEAKRIHVAFSPVKSECYGNQAGVSYCTDSQSLFHARFNDTGRRGRWSYVDGSIGQASPRYALATHGRKVAIAYGDPGNSGYLTVRSKAF